MVPLILAVGRQKQENLWGLLASKSNQILKFQVLWDTLFKKNDLKLLKHDFINYLDNAIFKDVYICIMNVIARDFLKNKAEEKSETEGN